MRHALLLAVALSSGCLRSTAFTCTDDTSCGPAGTCQPTTKFCSTADTECGPNGQRYGDTAGDGLAGQCVGGAPMPDAAMIDAPNPNIDMAIIDSSIDAPPDGPDVNCDPQVFTDVGGRLFHEIAQNGKWDAQRTACAALAPPGHAYLAVPEDEAELTAIHGINNNAWVGIHRDGVNFVNTIPPTQTMIQSYLPWDGGTPDNTNNYDCVNVESPTTIQTDHCPSVSRPAICECHE